MSKRIKKKAFICTDYAKYLIPCQQPRNGTVEVNPNMDKKADSELLDGLIKALCKSQIYITLIEEKKLYVCVTRHTPTRFQTFEGSTPREAIEAAVAKYNERSNHE